MANLDRFLPKFYRHTSNVDGENQDFKPDNNPYNYKETTEDRAEALGLVGQPP
jgi:hypothetical protein